MEAPCQSQWLTPVPWHFHTGSNQWIDVLPFFLLAISVVSIPLLPLPVEENFFLVTSSILYFPLLHTSLVFPFRPSAHSCSSHAHPGSTSFINHLYMISHLRVCCENATRHSTGPTELWACRGKVESPSCSLSAYCVHGLSRDLCQSSELNCQLGHSIIIPILQLRKLRLTAVMWLADDHWTNMWWSKIWIQDCGTLQPAPPPCTPPPQGAQWVNTAQIPTAGGKVINMREEQDPFWRNCRRAGLLW